MPQPAYILLNRFETEACHRCQVSVAKIDVYISDCRNVFLGKIIQKVQGDSLIVFQCTLGEPGIIQILEISVMNSRIIIIQLYGIPGCMTPSGKNLVQAVIFQHMNNP